MSEFDQNQQDPGAAPQPEVTPEAAAPPPPAYEQAAPPPPVYDQAAPPPPVYDQAQQYQQPAQSPYVQAAYANAEKPMHVPSLILGILGIIFAFIFGPVGLVLSIVGMVMAKKNKLTHKTTAGFALSIVGLILGIIFTLVWVVALAALGAMGLGLMALAGM